MQENVRNLSPESEFTRREFVAAMAAGFTLAAHPLSAAQAIATDAAGLVAGDVKIPVNSGTIPAYRAMPSGGGPFPIVLVVQEIFGVHEHIKDICRRFAKLKYLAVAPDLYARQGDVSKLENMNDIMKIVSQVPDAQVMSDLDDAADWAAKNQGNPKAVGVTGFCWGGRIVWLYVAHSPKVKTGVAWYGRLTGQTTDLQPKNPLDLVSSLKASVLGLYGGKDQGISLDSVEQMRKALKDAGNPSEIIVYPDAPHGFFADYRPSYRKDAAEDGWKRLLGWFKKYGVA